FGSPAQSLGHPLPLAFLEKTVYSSCLRLLVMNVFAMIPSSFGNSSASFFVPSSTLRNGYATGICHYLKLERMYCKIVLVPLVQLNRSSVWQSSFSIY